MFLKVLQIVAAAGTIATGLVSLIAPKSVTGFTGLIPNGGRGINTGRVLCCFGCDATAAGFTGFIPDAGRSLSGGRRGQDRIHVRRQVGGAIECHQCRGRGHLRRHLGAVVALDQIEVKQDWQ